MSNDVVHESLKLMLEFVELFFNNISCFIVNGTSSKFKNPIIIIKSSLSRYYIIPFQGKLSRNLKEKEMKNDAINEKKKCKIKVAIENLVYDVVNFLLFNDFKFRG